MNVRRYAVVFSGLLLLAGVFGCGSATNNDQGVSFLFTGFYPSTATSVTGTGLSGLSLPFTAGDTEAASFGGNDAVVAIGTQNNLVGQGIRLQRVFLSYYIPGSSAQPPSTSAGLSQALGPNGEATDIPSTLPPGYGNLPNSVVTQVSAVPFEIREWMVFNRTSLPEPPFVMDVTASVTGITTAGDRLDTNEGILTVTVTPDIIIPPTDGGSSSDSGGSSSSASSSGATGAGTDTGSGF